MILLAIYFFFFFLWKFRVCARHRTASGGADCKLGIAFVFGLFWVFFGFLCRLQQHCLQMFDFRSEKVYFFTLFFCTIGILHFSETNNNNNLSFQTSNGLGILIITESLNTAAPLKTAFRTTEHGWTTSTISQLFNTAFNLYWRKKNLHLLWRKRKKKLKK